MLTLLRLITVTEETAQQAEQTGNAYLVMQVAGVLLIVLVWAVLGWWHKR